MPWPSTITSFSNPVPTDRLNNPSHSSVETAQNTGLTELQTFIGVTTGATASALGTILYDIKAPNSNGGGHIQTANKGGTGQTTFTKGDILVAQNSSTLTKLALGIDTQVLTANSSTATGINWANTGNPKISTSASTFLISGTNDTLGDVSVISATIPASAMGTTNAIKGRVFLGFSDIRTSVLVRGLYGGSNVTSIMVRQPFPSGTGTTHGEIQHTLIANNSGTAQRSYLEVNMYSESAIDGVRSSVWSYYDTATSAVDSGVAQTFGVTTKQAGTGSHTINGNIVEKIS